MALVINTNVASLNAQRNISSSQSSLATSLQRLSSGLRVNSAKDDAAGLYAAELMSRRYPRRQSGCPQRQRRYLTGTDRGRRHGPGRQQPAAYS